MNPYLPEYEYIPDGEPHIFDGRVYVYGSHDCFNGKVFCMNDYVCYSADVSDLKNWRYEGVVYKRTQDPRMADGSRYLWAPDVICGKDGRYYMYYCPDGTTDGIGVAVCDEPAGKYSFYGTVHDKNGTEIGKRLGDVDQFDPAIFIDDDGEIYLYSGCGTLFASKSKRKGCVVMRLEDDMLTVKSEPVLLIPHAGAAKGTSFKEHPFFEASSMRKINGLYYLVYSSNKLHELCYAVSRYPDKDFRYGGVVISNTEIHGQKGLDYARNATGNNHGGILSINGEHYIFYHRATNNHGNSRQGCAERIDMAPNGQIAQAKMTSNGLQSSFKDKGTYPSAMACHIFRTDIKRKNDMLARLAHKLPYLTQDAPDWSPTDKAPAPRQYITNMKNNSAAVFRYFDIPDVGEIKVTVRADKKAKLLIKTEAEEKPLASVDIMPCSEWQPIAIKLEKPLHLKTLCICCKGKGSVQMLEFEII